MLYIYFCGVVLYNSVQSSFVLLRERELVALLRCVLAGMWLLLPPPPGVVVMVCGM